MSVNLAAIFHSPLKTLIFPMKKLKFYFPLILGYIYFLLFQKPFWLLFSGSNKIKIKGKLVGCKLNISGKNNTIIIEDSFMRNVRINITGDNHVIHLHKGVRFLEGGRIRLEDSGNRLEIKEKSNIINAFFSLADCDTSITVGEDCLLSSDVVVRTSDSHSIIDLKTGQRINFGKSVVIGNHVWVGNGVNILKGSEIGNDCIIGTQSLVTRSIPDNSLAVGNPTKVIKTDVTWNVKRISPDSTNFH